MLEIQGRSNSFCDGVSRRGFLRAGFLGLGGLSLSDVLRLSAAQGSEAKLSSLRSVIVIWLHGGPSQLETYDLKPDAPAEIRGPYKPISTNVPGIQICEKLPRLAALMDKSILLRGCANWISEHGLADGHWMTGYFATVTTQPPFYPSIGSAVSYLLGPQVPGVPPYVNINRPINYDDASYLGMSHNPFRVDNKGDIFAGGSADSLAMAEGLNPQRLGTRLSLTRRFDRLQREVDQSGMFDSMDRFDQQAAEMLLSGRARKAFDLSLEDPKTRERYSGLWGQKMLLTRRLVEAGVRFVTFSMMGDGDYHWDDHTAIQYRCDLKLPMFDHLLATLLEDLDDRGLLDDTLVAVFGEFGRTPKINAQGGRDHSAPAQSILIAGGGYRGGQVYGATNNYAEHPIDGRLEPHDLCAIMLHTLGLAPDTPIRGRNPADRPMPLLPGGSVPKELL